MDNFDSLVFVNPSGDEVVLSDPTITKWWELRGRSGFTAPPVEIISQKYANGITRVVKRLVSPRTVTVSMVVTGDTTAERDEIFFDMVDKLMDVITQGVGKLYVGRSDGLVFCLNCVYSSGLSIVEEYELFHRFTLEFYAADPYFYREFDDAVINIPPTSKLTLRDGVALGNHKLGEIAGTTTGTITNEGGASIQPIIIVPKVVGSIVIKNLTTGAEIALSGIGSQKENTLVFDTREDSRSIYIEHPDGSRESAGQYLDWDNLDYTFDIIPGENQISFTVGEGSYTEGLIFRMAERHLSA